MTKAFVRWLERRRRWRGEFVGATGDAGRLTVKKQDK